MSSAWLSAAIQEFEQVSLDNGTELFRVRARAQRGDDPDPRPVLVTREQDGTSHVYEPMSSGGDRRGLMRLAYTLPSDRVGPSTAFSLRLPDGYRIELPEPTAGEHRLEPEDGQPWPDAPSDPQTRGSAVTGNGAGGRIAELEQELRSTRQSVAQARSELERAHAERDEALQTAREQLVEHARLTARVRQLQARTELLRADATGAQPGIDPRLRRLESEREQLATHIRALAELVSIDERADDADDAAELDGAVAHGVAQRLAAIRAQAVREANEHAERELRRLRARTPL